MSAPNTLTSAADALHAEEVRRTRELLRIGWLIAIGVVVAFSLVTGRILELATDSNLFTGVALSLTYFLLINLLLSLAVGSGGG